MSDKHRQVISHPHVGGGVVGREEAGELQIQQSGIQMMMTGIDAPGWFFHKAIPPHHFLGGGVPLSQHSRDNVAVWPPVSASLSAKE